eukprot:COSAG02_NODE_8558_length_2524_cov_1.027216_2_plen_220_part_00
MQPGYPSALCLAAPPPQLRRSFFAAWSAGAGWQRSHRHYSPPWVAYTCAGLYSTTMVSLAACCRLATSLACRGSLASLRRIDRRRAPRTRARAWVWPCAHVLRAGSAGGARDNIMVRYESDPAAQPGHCMILIQIRPPRPTTFALSRGWGWALATQKRPSRCPPGGARPYLSCACSLGARRRSGERARGLLGCAQWHVDAKIGRSLLALFVYGTWSLRP